MDSRTLLADFHKAIGQLQGALQLPAANDVYKAGCIQYFEFSFELAWKTVKRMAEDEGMADCNSPKSALKAAFSRGWLQEEEVWLEMLAARNKMAHTYHAAEALTIFDNLPRYAASLHALAQTLSSINH
jgi:nucleotidyltransferase substrate binding protein (TIGR01987 family)